jgi:penicillin-binding protein 2
MREEYHPLVKRARAQGALVILATLLLLLTAGFFRAQVLRNDDYALRSDMNRLRPQVVPAARGTIFDRDGLVVADNVPGWSVSLLPAPADSLRAILGRLQPLLGLGDQRVDDLLEAARRAPGQPVLLTSDAHREMVAALEERRADFPGVLLEMRPKRRYIHGQAVAHIVGYVGEISRGELEDARFSDYEQGMIVGKEGVERSYESGLQGEQGIRLVEVDARGRVVGSFLGQSAAPAAPGEDLHLNIDLELQAFIHSIFPDSLTGAVVALDPSDGGILALYSHPAYDPNDFVGGIDTETWDRLNTDPRLPLYNRAVMGLSAPASTFKTVTAAMGLELGIVTPESRMPVPCNGGLFYGGAWRRCWNAAGHGSLDLTGALAHSCNVYFYQLGMQIGLGRFLEQGNAMGFGERCGVDLPRESPGTFPEDEGFWERRFGYRGQEGEILSMAIGQGPNDQTVLKMAQFYLALARDGTAPAPSLRKGGTGGEGWKLDLSPASIRALRLGLQAVTAPGGTAYMSSLQHWDLMGKTGSGQTANSGRPNAWFAGMAGPWGAEPEIVVVALAEFGMGGSATAAPIAAKAADFYLRKRHGIPFDSVQTLREHIMTGRPAPWAGRAGSLLGVPAGGPEEGPDPDAPPTPPSPGGDEEPVAVLPPPSGR